VTLPSAYQESWRRLPDELVMDSHVNPGQGSGSCSGMDSDESLTHIYSSICESNVSTGLANTSKNKKDKKNGMGKRLSRATNIPKTFKFFMKRNYSSANVSPS